MTTLEKIQAVKDWLDFEEAWLHTRGESPRLLDWEVHLTSQQAQDALREVRAIAESMLEDDFTRGPGERLLAELEGAGA